MDSNSSTNILVSKLVDYNKYELVLIDTSLSKAVDQLINRRIINDTTNFYSDDSTVWCLDSLNNWRDTVKSWDLFELNSRLCEFKFRKIEG